MLALLSSAPLVGQFRGQIEVGITAQIVCAEVEGPLILGVDEVTVADHASLSGGLLRLEVVQADCLLR